MKTITKYLTFTSFLLIMTACCVSTININTNDSEIIKFTDKIIEEKLSLEPFNKICLKNWFKINLIQSNVDSLEIKMDSALIEYVSYKVKNNVLNLNIENAHDSNTNIINNEKYAPIVNIYFKDLENIEARGAVSINIKNKLNIGDNNSLNLDINGAVDLVCEEEIINGELNIDISGAANINLKTKDVKNINYDISGAANLEDRIINSDNVKIESSGATNINLEGNVNTLEVNMNGVGKIEGKNLTAKHLDLDCAGANIGNFTATESIEACLTGPSVVKIYGEPKDRKLSVGKISFLKFN